jgi:hypothetical protein
MTIVDGVVLNKDASHEGACFFYTLILDGALRFVGGIEEISSEFLVTAVKVDPLHFVGDFVVTIYVFFIPRAIRFQNIFY